MDNTILVFKDLYNEVIDSEGNVRACGRDKCILLMDLAKSIRVHGDFGDRRTGRINIDNIKKLHNELS
jgi:hypothetical protein